MRLMIASDIHGSAKYCGLMLEAFEREKAQRLLLLGDILYHGPRNDLPEAYDPKKVIDMLNAVNDRIFCVRGNCDTEVDQMVLRFPLMADYAVLFWAGRIVYATHGHHFHMQNPPPMGPGDILLHGHTHVPSWTPFGQDQLCLNPGSVSIPKDGSSHSYMLLDGMDCYFKTLDGTVYHSLKLTPGEAAGRSEK